LITDRVEGEENALITNGALAACEDHANVVRRFTAEAATGHAAHQPVAHRAAVPIRLVHRSSPTVQSFCFTFNQRRVRPPSYTLVSSFAT
jgi:hypothetical protein